MTYYNHKFHFVITAQTLSGINKLLQQNINKNLNIVKWQTMGTEKFRDKEASVSHIYIVLDFEIYSSFITTKNQNKLKSEILNLIMK